MELTLPENWEQLTQEQLRTVIGFYVHYDGLAAWEQKTVMAAFVCLAGIVVDSETAEGWLCTRGGESFVLDRELLPAIAGCLEWLRHPEDMHCRIETAAGHKACPFDFNGLEFGNYLAAENYFEGYLRARNPQLLQNLCRLLYGVGEGESAEFDQVEAAGAFLWFSAAKKELGNRFPHFLKPAEGAEGGKRATPAERTRQQIRLLTKGDVTKEEAVINVNTLSALAELDALAVEAEELRKIRNKNKKH